MSRCLVVLVVAGSVLAGSPVFAQLVPSDPLGPVVVIAHRGASSYAPEHTYPAYDLAVEMDTDFLECDLQISRDDVLVCIHDTTVDRTSDGSGSVRSMTLAQLRSLDWGSWFSDEFVGAELVTFEEQLDCYLAHNPRMRFHVETKGPATYDGRMEELLVELLGRKGLLATGGNDVQTSTVLIQSFDPDSLEIVKQLAPTLPTVLLWPAIGAPSPELAEAHALFLEGLLPAYVDAAAPNALAPQFDATMVAKFHLNGHEVHPWTVDDRETMDTLLDMGVDGIFTNRPDVLREAVDERGTGVTAEARGNPAAFARGCPTSSGTSQPQPADDPDPVGELPTSGGGAVAVGVLALAALLARRER